ncbi:hypothetical protein J5226_18060 [Lysobacter sp. K5869]|uniref:hypothetical protein n=1 Tax=Lysobacter sp. K5869 TaxID=2820808 RepID=UPI001C063B94|nr:hypothetical protein [Lysobacter sp. K5869]QWP75504.1 hypothetical protein J5226_18060 [Lysobacter sp. K5869]
MKHTHALLSAALLCVAQLAAGSASATCYEHQGTATGDARWVVGLDGVGGTADDGSLQIDNALMRNIRPAECSGTYGCDIIAYRIQWFGGGWSDSFIPGHSDFHKRGDNSLVKGWSMLNDHSYKILFCN